MSWFRSRTLKVAITSMMAALIVAVSRLPGLPAIGAPTKIEFTTVLYPVIGILLGPELGFVASFLGNFIAWIIPSTTMFGLLVIPAGALASLVAGFLTGRSERGWLYGSAVLAVLIACWYVSPVGFEAPFYPVFHMAALALSLTLGKKLKGLLDSEGKRLVWGSAVTSYVAAMTDSMYGNLAYVGALGIIIPLKEFKSALKAMGILWAKTGIPKPADYLAWIGLPVPEELTLGYLFMAVLPITIAERITITLVSTLISIAVVRAFKTVFTRRQPSKESKKPEEAR
ncbi:ECF transporter S component [Candidatus Bathyarchaeota archaeon]|nr:ECF transporter S component [Candidatus Bathyarchaeota archaeon]